MKVNRKAIATLAVPALLVASPILAANEGQIEGGNIYRVKNVTQNVDFADPANAKACDVLQYKVRIHNPGPGSLSNVNVKASVPSNAAMSNTSTITVSSQNADPQSTSDTAVVNFDSVQGESFVAGSTELLDANGNAIKSLSDGITEGGVNIGSVGVSIDNKRFVQFKEKVNCPTPNNPETPGKGGQVNPANPAQPSTLPDTGAEAGLAGMTGAGALGYAVHMYRRSRRAMTDALRNRK